MLLQQRHCILLLWRGTITETIKYISYYSCKLYQTSSARNHQHRYGSVRTLPNTAALEDFLSMETNNTTTAEDTVAVATTSDS